MVSNQVAENQRRMVSGWYSGVNSNQTFVSISSLLYLLEPKLANEPRGIPDGICTFRNSVELEGHLKSFYFSQNVAKLSKIHFFLKFLQNSRFDEKPYCIGHSMNFEEDFEMEKKPIVKLASLDIDLTTMQIKTKQNKQFIRVV